MTRKIVMAVAIAAFACGLSVSSAAVKHHTTHHVAVHPSGAHAEATTRSSGNSSGEEIQGVNPMTNSPAIPPAPNKQPYVAMPGVNPM